MPLTPTRPARELIVEQINQQFQTNFEVSDFTFGAPEASSANGRNTVFTMTINNGPLNGRSSSVYVNRLNLQTLLGRRIVTVPYRPEWLNTHDLLAWIDQTLDIFISPEDVVSSPINASVFPFNLTLQATPGSYLLTGQVTFQVTAPVSGGGGGEGPITWTPATANNFDFTTLESWDPLVVGRRGNMVTGTRSSDSAEFGVGVTILLNNTPLLSDASGNYDIEVDTGESWGLAPFVNVDEQIDYTGTASTLLPFLELTLTNPNNLAAPNADLSRMIVHKLLSGQSTRTWVDDADAVQGQAGFTNVGVSSFTSEVRFIGTQPAEGFATWPLNAYNTVAPIGVDFSPAIFQAVMGVRDNLGNVIFSRNFTITVRHAQFGQQQGGGGNTGTNPFNALYAPDWSAISDFTFYSRPNEPKPAKTGTLATPGYIDQRFGTRVYRGTAIADTPSADANLRHAYSRQRVWNCDSTRFVVRASNGFWYLYDADTCVRIDGGRTNAVGLGALLGFVDQCEVTWHPTDPNKIWRTDNLGGLVWYEFDINTKVTVPLFDLGPLLAQISGFSGAARTWFKNEGRPSDDGNRWALMVETSAFATIGLIMYDRPSNQIIGHILTTNRPDHISTSPCGLYAVPSWYTGSTGTLAEVAARPINSANGARAYTADFGSFTQLSVLGEHSDLGVDAEGNSVFISVTYRGGVGGNEAPLSDGVIYYRRLDNGQAYELPFNVYQNAGNAAVHISALNSKAKPGWCVLSSYGSFTPSTWGDGIIAAIELVPNNARVIRLAHSQYRTADYFAEPQAVANDDLSRIGWATDFGDGNIEFFFLGVPDRTFLRGPTLTTAPVISGTNTIGSTLTAVQAVWNGATTVTGQWYVDGVATGVTTLTYVVQANGAHTYRSTATNAIGPSSSNSNTIQVGPLPGETRTPSIRGSAIYRNVRGASSETVPVPVEAGDAILVAISLDDLASPYGAPTISDGSSTFTLVQVVDTDHYGGARRNQLSIYLARNLTAGTKNVQISSDGNNNMSVGILPLRDVSTTQGAQDVSVFDNYASGAINVGPGLSQTVGNSLGVLVATSYEAWQREFAANAGLTEVVYAPSQSDTAVPLYIATAPVSSTQSPGMGFNFTGGGAFIAAAAFRIPGAPL